MNVSHAYLKVIQLEKKNSLEKAKKEFHIKRYKGHSHKLEEVLLFDLLIF